MKKFFSNLIIFVFGSFLVELLMLGTKNKTQGRTFFGKKKTPKRTFEDLEGNVHLNSEDGKVV